MSQPPSKIRSATPQSTSGASRGDGHPPRKSGPMIRWAGLSICLILGAIPLLLGLTRQDVTDPQEAETLSVAIQTLDHHAQAPDRGDGSPESFIPYRDSDPRLRDPPGSVWVLLTAFRLFGSDSTSTLDLIRIGRLTSVVMGLLTIAAVYWAGLSLEGIWTGVMGALICATNAVFVFHSRGVSPEAFFLGWSTLSLGGALWASRPMRPIPSILRQAVGWGVCGVGLCAGVLTLGPRAVPLIVVPIGLILLMCPNRFSHLLGLLASVLIGLLGVLPWAIYTHEQAPGVWEMWVGELTPTLWGDPNDGPGGWGIYPWVAVAVTFPWGLWLIGAVTQLLSRSSSGIRLRLGLTWAWWISVVIVFVFWLDAMNYRMAMCLVPGFSVLVAQTLHRYIQLHEEGQSVFAWSVLGWSQVAVIVLGSGGMLVAGYQMRETLLDQAWPGQGIVTPMVWMIVLGAGGGTSLVLIALSIKWLWNSHPKRSLVTWVLWGEIAMTCLVGIGSQIPTTGDPVRPVSEQMNVIIAADPVYRLTDYRLTDPGVSPVTSGDEGSPDPGLWVYLRRPVPGVDRDQLQRVRGEDRVFYLIAPASSGPTDATTEAPVISGAGWSLWRCE